MSIKIVKAKNGVDYVTASKTQSDPANPKGYFRVEQVTEGWSADGWDTTTTKSMLFKGLVSKLNERLASMNYTMKGSLFIEEIVESDLDKRPDLKKQIVSEDLRAIPINEYSPEEAQAYEEALARSGRVKRTGANGVELRSNGERILRFTSYDPTGTKEDTLVPYTNAEEVIAERIASRKRTAELPK